VDLIPDYVTWATWLAAVGVRDIDASRGPRFSHTFLSLQAAAAGQGVALATSVLIGDYLEAGRLARPFPQEVKGTSRYYVACPEAAADRPAISDFRAWLLAEARGQR
jgi:LysR family glycine cleavage system transcriptional activator